MSILGFFRKAESLVRREGALGRQVRTPVEMLDYAVDLAMLDVMPYGNGMRYVIALKPGQGREVRARLLLATGHIGLSHGSMRPGESMAEWLGRCLRGHLTHDQILPLLRRARLMRKSAVRHQDLAQRAPV